MIAPWQRPSFRWWDAVLAVVGVSVFLGASLFGLGPNLGLIALAVYLPVALARRVWAGFQGGLALAFVRRPFAPEHRWLLAQAVTRWLSLGVFSLVLRAALIPAQLGEHHRSTSLVCGAILGGAALFALVPHQRVFASRLAFAAALALIFGGQLAMAAVPAAAAEVVAMGSPLRAEAVVVHGGRSPLLNHHFAIAAQRHALDLVVLKNGKWSEGDEANLSSYGCFGATVAAPLAGTVVKAVDDLPDMAIGKMDRRHAVGNHLVLQVAPERFVLFAHLKHGSVVVREGARVQRGAALAECGNSGNTSLPHLHLQVQSRADFAAPDLRTFPIAFGGLVLAGGTKKLEGDQGVRRNDRIQAASAMPE